MAQGQKYADLPGLDEAPDTYETIEDVKETKSTKTSRSSSSSTSSQDAPATPNTEDELASGISRSQLRLGEARAQFGPSRVDARGVDFSDRVDGRKSYKVSKRKNRTEFDGKAGVVEREDETLKEKIARLKREVEEVKALGESEKKSKDREDAEDVVRDLSEVLGQLDDDRRKRGAEDEAAAEVAKPKEQQTQQRPPTKSPAELLALPLPDPTTTSRTLTLAATLESRVNTLESALGLPALSLPSTTNSTTDSSTTSTRTTPVLTTLTTLHSSLQTLTTTTLPSLTTLTTQIDALTTRANNLAAARRSALAALKDLRTVPPLPFPSAGASNRPFSSGTSASFSTSRPNSYARSRAPTGATSFENVTGNAASGPESDGQAIDPALVQTLLQGEESETASRVNKLHAQLPTIEALAPLLPSVLDRLGDLRLLHAEAAGAGETMRVVEGRLEAVGKGVGEWRTALEELEERVQEAEKVEGGNRETVEGWVKELEGRVKAAVDDAKVV